MRAIAREVALVVARGAEVEHGAAEEAELHAALDEQGEVAVGERLERGDGAPDVALAAVLDRVADGGAAGLGELLRPGEHLARCSSDGSASAGAWPGSASHSRTWLRVSA